MDNLSLSAEERFEKFYLKYPALLQKYPKTNSSYIGVTPEFLTMKSRCLKGGAPCCIEYKVLIEKSIHYLVINFLTVIIMKSTEHYFNAYFKTKSLNTDDWFPEQFFLNTVN
jgi:hypothetical protein